MVKIWKQQ